MVKVPEPVTPQLGPDGKPPAPVVPRDPDSGAIINTLTPDELMRAYVGDKDFKDRPGRYYFSKNMICFRKAWYEAKKVAKDPGAPPYDDGDSEAGNAVENHLKAMLQKVYGYEGSILKNIRFSEPVHTEFEGPDGKTQSVTIYIIGRTDLLIIGDNFQVLDFWEVKSAKFWSAPKEALEKMLPTKEVPLRLAQIESPDGKGAVSINHLVQLAIGCKILKDKGLNPSKKRLLYVDRVNMNHNVSILLTDAEVEYLYDLGVMWTTEHHAHLQASTPPPAQFFMGWECKYCPFAQRCTSELKKAGQQRGVHPAMRGINTRIAAVNKSAPTPAKEKACTKM